MTSWELFKETMFMRAFGLFKVPLIALVRPSIVAMTNEMVVVKIPLNIVTRNHLKSMYFGTLAIGADCAGGYLAVRKILKERLPLTFVFKDFKAEFLKRPDGDVHFTCREGSRIAQTMAKALATGERENDTLLIEATVPSRSEEVVARFHLTLSIKKKA